MSDLNLDKIDVLRARLGVSYGTAKAALEKANGDVVEALVMLEKEQAEDNGFQGELVNRIRRLIARGNTRKIRIKKDGETVAEIPATVGALGLLSTIAYTPLAVVGAIGSVSAMFNRYSLEIERNEAEEAATGLDGKNME